MGETKVVVRIHGPNGHADLEMLADTGATLTLVPESVARSVGIRREGSVKVKLADGRIKSLPVGKAEIELRGDRAPIRIIIGSEGVALLGLTALETLGLKVNTVERRLEPSVYNQFSLASPTTS